MNKIFAYFVVGAVVALFGSQQQAQAGLVIHAAEFGVGKFHRQDNKVHAYTKNDWSVFILPEGAKTDTALIEENADHSFTVYFSTLDELIGSVLKLSTEKNEKVSVLNVHGHGLPGAMWFPATAEDLKEWYCADWVSAANGSDQGNYNQYYSAVDPSSIRQIRQISNNPNVHMPCTTGLKEWKAGVARAPQFKSVFAADAQLHFLSCVVGLGTQGDAFTQGIAQLLLPNGAGRVETSMNFGLGDWSMNEGMGFWDMQSDAQVERDNATYIKNKRDRDIAQKGTIRMAAHNGTAWKTTLLSNRDFMALGFETVVRGDVVPASEAPVSAFEVLPLRVRVPGTQSYVWVESNR